MHQSGVLPPQPNPLALSAPVAAFQPRLSMSPTAAGGPAPVIQTLQRPAVPPQVVRPGPTAYYAPPRPVPIAQTVQQQYVQTSPTNQPQVQQQPQTQPPSAQRKSPPRYPVDDPYYYDDYYYDDYDYEYDYYRRRPPPPPMRSRSPPRYGPRRRPPSPMHAREEEYYEDEEPAPASAPFGGAGGRPFRMHLDLREGVLHFESS
uniref:Uncharacterized protein n=1 Tax=Chromera velia CCMP2878 TaxID=1169474 RepID=A0A0G4FZR8_9ALVE|eukprot:Cvel_19547.t1-p1 / transcript=Cvel_19547.t1 / gene=Cvel_19547 / organism=Chromera_velia_CCMP2878 / gene_product=hypothetical protein / transcript_product=hypothetical protein / location=Cvel_scaffold1694:3403-5411(+) / protein_length=202 / sequence_SO=supercontig / SO=protein_coding / is_pseudo=false